MSAVESQKLEVVTMVIDTQARPNQISPSLNGSTFHCFATPLTLANDGSDELPISCGWRRLNSGESSYVFQDVTNH